MAMNKIERLDREIQRTREKITEYQNKLKELTAQKTEAENLQIVQLVRAMRLFCELVLQSGGRKRAALFRLSIAGRPVVSIAGTMGREGL